EKDEQRRRNGDRQDGKKVSPPLSRKITPCQCPPIGYGNPSPNDRIALSRPHRFIGGNAGGHHGGNKPSDQVKPHGQTSRRRQPIERDGRSLLGMGEGQHRHGNDRRQQSPQARFQQNSARHLGGTPADGQENRHFLSAGQKNMPFIAST